MPFDSLSDEQQDFITSHFRTGRKLVRRSKKTRTADELFNDEFKSAMTPLYERINEIDDRITALEAQYGDEFPEQFYRQVLDKNREQIKTTLKENSKKLKKREIPDFSQVAESIEITAEQVELFRTQLESGKDLQAVAGEKNDAIETMIDSVNVHFVESLKHCQAVRSRCKDVCRRFQDDQFNDLGTQTHQDGVHQ